MAAQYKFGRLSHGASRCLSYLRARNRPYVGLFWGSRMKTYTDGYLDALLDIKNEIMDRTVKELDTVLDEMIQDLRSL